MGEIKAKARFGGRNGSDLKGVIGRFMVEVPVEADLYEDGSWQLRGVKDKGETKPSVIEVPSEFVEAAIADSYSDDDVLEAYEGALELHLEDAPDMSDDEDPEGDLQ